MLVCLNVMARGQTSVDYHYWFDNDAQSQRIVRGISSTWQAEIDVSSLPPGLHAFTSMVRDSEGMTSQPVTRYFVRTASAATSPCAIEYWFDTDHSPHHLSQTNGSVSMLDVSTLPDGLHWAYFLVRQDGKQSEPVYRPFIKLSTVEHSSLQAILSVDGQVIQREEVAPDGGVLNCNLDVSSLTDGLHRFAVVVSSLGQGMSEQHEAYFYHAGTVGSRAVQCIWSVDGGDLHHQAQNMGAGTFRFDADVASLSDGLHEFKLALLDESGSLLDHRSEFFIKHTKETTGITYYNVWLNDRPDLSTTTIIDPAQDPYSLVTMLPVAHVPLRTSDFHFEFTPQGQPVLYARNDLHVRFEDAEGRMVTVSAPFIDTEVSCDVTDVSLLISGVSQSHPYPVENTIKWFKFDAGKGDSLSLKTDHACTLQLFSPSGQELLHVMGTDVFNWCDVLGDASGTYYVALHDVTDPSGSVVTIEFAHVKCTASPLEEEDWNVLKSFYQQYHNDSFVWDLRDPLSAALSEGLTVENSRVVAITLPGRSLDGTFPTMLLSLECLQTLDLSHNRLSGDASAAIAQYASEHAITGDLQVLCLSHNDFTGNVGTLAEAFASLKTLDVSSNHFDCVSPMVSPGVTLNINDQLLEYDANITSGLDALFGSIPDICLYDHSEQRMQTSLELSVTHASQTPQWHAELTFDNGQLSIDAPIPYKDSNGQVLAGTTSLPGTWPNEQQLQVKFTFSPGDGNIDGQVDVLDLQSTLNYMFEDTSGQPFNYTAANLWSDATVNVQDAVCLVNLLLDSEKSQSPGSRLLASSSAAEASVYVENGQLVINSSVPVSAFDLVITTTQACDDFSALQQLGFTCHTKRNGNLIHLVGYSLNGSCLPVGKTVLCRLSQGMVNYAMLANREAKEIVTSKGCDHSALQTVDHDKHSSVVYRIPLDAFHTLVIDSEGKKYLIKNEK